MMGLSPMYLKLIGGLVAALLLLGLIADRGRWMRRAHGDEAQLAEVCAATRDAAVNPNLGCKSAPKQIRLLGQAIADLKAGIARQNAAVAALGAESERQKAEAAKAVEKAQGRAEGAQATAERLAASSRSGEASAKPCAPSKALTGAWK
jgi:hypothetical protein